MILTRSSSRNCKMTFIIARGFAERQILKKSEMALSLKLSGIFANIDTDKIYPKRLRNDIFHWSRLCRAPNSEKKVITALSLELSRILWWNFAYTLYPMRLSNVTCDWLSFCRGSNSEKSETIAKWHFSSVEALPSAKFWKSETCLISWNEWNILIDFCVNIDIIKI